MGSLHDGLSFQGRSLLGVAGRQVLAKGGLSPLLALLLGIGLPSTSGCGGSAPPAEQPATEPAASDADRAIAEMYPTQRSEVSGTIVLRMTDTGGLLLKGNLNGLPAGSHAIAIHDKGDCTAHDAKSVGALFNPAGAEAPIGMLGDVKTVEPGKTELDLVVEGLELTGPSSVLERSLVVHAWPYDPAVDLATVPYLACGVIRPR